MADPKGKAPKPGDAVAGLLKSVHRELDTIDKVFGSNGATERAYEYLRGIERRLGLTPTRSKG